MLKDKNTIDYIAFKNGSLTFLALVVYFLIMKIIGLLHIVELRSLNFLIMIGGVSLAFRNYSRITGSGINYFDGLGLGIKTTLVSVLPFALFIFIYLMIDGAFMETIRQKEMFGSYLNPFLLSFLIAFEGSLSGFFIAFVLMQYYKRRTITE